jgi:hypothetical protein
MKNLSAILQAFRHNLPNSSPTAQAIDRGALLEEISQAAAIERIHQLAAILFEAEQEETQPNPDKEIDLEALINNQIRQLRSNLPDGSKIARDHLDHVAVPEGLRSNCIVPDRNYTAPVYGCGNRKREYSRN